MRSPLGQRVVIGTLLFFVFVGCTWAGNGIFYALILLVTWLAFLEYIRLTLPSRRFAILIVSWLFIGVTTYMAYQQVTLNLWLSVLVAVFWVAFASLLLHGVGMAPMAAFWAFGLLYLTVPAAMALQLRHLGMFYVFFPAFVVIVFDTAAFLFGKWLGRHFLAPRLSPKKTWEGFLGGYLVALTFALLVPLLDFQVRLWSGLLLPVAAQVGDLVESGFKRYSGVKDASHMLGSHGGVLDRIDSHYFAVPFFYLILLFLGRLGG